MATLMQIGKDGRLSPMKAEPYGTETELQACLAQNPELLSADEEGDRRWLLIRREMAVPIQGADAAGGNATGFIDHLFVDQAGVPTIVEVKRASNTEARRQVAGQILDYAANAPLHWTGDVLRQAFEAPLVADGKDPQEILSHFLDDADADAEGFWEQVEAHLREGRVRLVFVMDAVPPSLQRIVEFMNRQMASVEVMAVEIRRHSGADGTILEVQRKGETASRRRAAPARPQAPTVDAWRRAFILRHGAEISDGLDAVMEFMSRVGRVFATSSSDPSLGVELSGLAKGRYPLFVKGSGRLTVTFSYLRANAALADYADRADWAERLRAAADGRGRFGEAEGSDLVFDKDLLRDVRAVHSILTVVEDMISTLRP